MLIEYSRSESLNPLTHVTNEVEPSQTWSHLWSCPILLDEPDRIVDPVSWVEHVPFAFWIVHALRPSVLVELGTHSGNSYAAFAQAVQQLDLNTACYAVDTWKGDPQAGMYGEEVFTEWSAYHDRRYSAFSRLVRTTFAEAAGHFQDGSVDLLHVDGCHTLEAVSADFDLWLPKMSRRGVMLLHDINVRERDFGCWQFWERVRALYPSFAFLHGHGLGVLGVGPDRPEPVAWLLSRSIEGAEIGRIRSLFARLGAGVLLRHMAGQRERSLLHELKEKDRQRLDLSDESRRLRGDHAAEMARAHHELAERRAHYAAEIASAQRKAASDEEEKRSLRKAIRAAQAESSNLRLAAAAARQEAAERQGEDEEFSERLRRAEETVQAQAVALSQWGRGRAPGNAQARQTAPPGTAPTAADRLSATVRLRARGFPRRAELRALFRPAVGGRVSAGEALRLLRRPATIGQIRHANTVFAPAWYCSRNLDLAARGTNALAHFLLAGDLERRQPHPLFDPSYYLCQGPRVPPGMGPFHHFLTIGWRAGLNPHPLFDTRYYLRRYPDVVSGGLNPLVHYLRHGVGERRQAHALFDPRFYLEQNPDVAGEAIDPLTHYVVAGAREGRNPNPFFDSAYYLAAHPDVGVSEANPLVHFVLYGWREKRRPSPAFDTGQYLADHPDLLASGTNPVAHFIEHREPAGAAADRTGAARRAQFRVRCLEPVQRARPVVVCLSHVMPWPPRAGNEYRVFRLLRHLRSRGYTIVPVIAPLPDTEVTAEGLRELAGHFGNAVLCDRDGRLEYILNDVPDVFASMNGDFTPGFSTLLGEAAANERQRAVVSADQTFCHDPAVATVRRLHRALGRSVLLAEYIWMSRVLPLLHDDVLKIIDTIDVFSNKREKVVQYGVQDWTVEREDEAYRLRRADLILAIQDEEAGQLRAIVPDIPVITTGVDFDVVPSAGPPKGKEILYVASGNPMNQKGLRDFLRFAWPRVRESVPDARLLVAGAVGRSLEACPDGVTCLGIVDDVGPLYSRSTLVINPAVAGTGVKIKTIEALSRLRRVVTWPSGIEGLPPEIARVCVTAGDWYEFSQQVIRLLQAGGEVSPEERAAIERFSAPEQAYAPLTRAIEQFWARP